MRRPCLALSVALGAGGFVGEALSNSAVAILGAGAVLLVVTLAVFPLALLSWRSRRGGRSSAQAMAVGLQAQRDRNSKFFGVMRAGATRGPPPWAWLVLMSLTAALLVARDAGRPVRELGDGRAALAGIWHSGPFGRDWLELLDGSRLAAELGTAGPAPADDDEVVLLPPFQRRAAAAGPVESPSAALLRVELAADQIARLSSHDSPSDAGLVATVRRELSERGSELPAPPGRLQSGLASALLVGDREHLSRDVADLFKRTGTLHLLALSGLHVGLFALLVAWPLRRASAALARRLNFVPPWPRRIGASIGGASVVLFAVLAGGGAPVVRASIAAVALLLVRDWPRSGPRTVDALSLLALGLVIELIADPLGWSNIGLAMSYGACLGLALAARPAACLVSRVLFRRGLNTHVDAVLWLGSKWRLATAIAVLRLQRLVAWGLGSSIAATLGTLPPQWHAFGEFSPVGIVATPVVSPLLAVWLPALWLGALAPHTLLAQPQAGVEWLALRLLEWFDTLPYTPLLLPERPTWWIVVCCALGLAALVQTQRATRWRVVERAALLAWAITLLPWCTAPRTLEVWALDVGHGTCVVARAPGLPLLVFDAGTSTRHGLERHALRPLLAHIDAGRGVLVISHLDRDHYSAVPWLTTRLEWQTIGGAWPEWLDEPAPRIDVVSTPGHVRGPVVPGAATWSLLRGSSVPGNEGSRNLVLEFGGARVLLCGDATGEGLARLVDAGLVPGHSDLVLMPHHGGHGSGVGGLLDRAAPKLAWISSETPAPIVNELARRGLDWRATWLSGPLGPWRPDDRGAPP